MIIVKKRKLKIKGKHPVELCTELVSAVKGILEALEKSGMPREEAIRLVRKSAEIAFMTDEELRAEAHKKASKMIITLGKAMADDAEGGQGDE